MLQKTCFIILSCAFLYGMSGIAMAQAQDPVQHRQATEQAADTKLKELNKKMDEFVAEAKDKGHEARTEINRLYDEFKHKQGNARKDLEEMRKTTNEAWDKVKARTERSIEELNGLYERAKSKDKEKEK